MKNHYADCSAEELLQGLQWAGRHPDLDLIRECLGRPDELTPGLLRLLEGENRDEAEGDAWYGQVHAGKLLIAFQEEDAMSLFGDLLCDSERATLLEWFDTDLHALGPSFLPTLLDVLQDESAPAYGRSVTVSTLGQIARKHTETRGRILTALRSELPSLLEDGTVDTPDNVTQDDIEYWSWLALELSELHDEESQPQVEALYEADYVDSWMIGDLDAYRDTLQGNGDHTEHEFDIVAEYDRRSYYTSGRYASATDSSRSDFSSS